MLNALKRAVQARGFSRSHSNLLDYLTHFPLRNNTELGQLKSMVEFYGRWLLTVTRITDGVALDPTPETDSLSEGASVGSGSSEGPVDTPSIHSSDSPHVYYDHPQFSLCYAAEIPTNSVWEAEEGTEEDASTSYYHTALSDVYSTCLDRPLPSCEKRKTLC